MTNCLDFTKLAEEQLFFPCHAHQDDMLIQSEPIFFDFWSTRLEGSIHSYPI